MRNLYALLILLACALCSGAAGRFPETFMMEGAPPNPYAESPAPTLWLNGCNTTSATARIGSNALFVANNCKQFGGAVDYLAIPSPPARTTIEYRARMTLPSSKNAALFGGGFTSSGSLIAFYESGGLSRFISRFSDGSGDRVQGLGITGADALFDDDFHDVVYSLDGNDFSVEIDGSEVLSATMTGGDGTADPDSLIAYIARHNGGGVPEPYYQGALSEATMLIDGSTYFTYTFASGPSATEHDVSGNGNDGTYTTTNINTMAVQDDNASAWNAKNGFSGTGTFDGVGDELNYGNVGGATSFTATARVKLNSLDRQAIFFKGTGPSSNTDMCLQILSSPNINFYGYDSGGSLVFNISADISSYLDEFVEIEVVLDGTNSVALKFNGSTVASATPTGLIRVSAGDLMVGVRSGVDYSDATYSLFELESGGATIVKSTFSDMQGTTVTDQSGNGNDGALTLNSTEAEFWGYRIPADQSDPTKDVLGNDLTNPGGFVHNGCESSLVIGGTTNSLTDLQAMDGYNGLPIRNYYQFTNAPSALFTNTTINIAPWSGVWEVTP